MWLSLWILEQELVAWIHTLALASCVSTEIMSRSYCLRFSQ